MRIDNDKIVLTICTRTDLYCGWVGLEDGHCDPLVTPLCRDAGTSLRMKTVTINERCKAEWDRPRGGVRDQSGREKIPCFHRFYATIL